MSRLQSAQSSRVNGSTAGFGVWGFDRRETRSHDQITADHQLAKRAAKASLAGDYELYNELMAQMAMNAR